jgi:hypothetical protein
MYWNLFNESAFFFYETPLFVLNEHRFFVSKMHIISVIKQVCL